VIEVQDLWVRYPDQPQPALRGVNLHLAKGEFALLTGPSGCGKSTLARCLMGLIPQSEPAEVRGAIRVNGACPATTPVSALAQQAGMVFQNPAAQLFNLQVADEVAFGPRNLGLPDGEVEERVAFGLQAAGIERLRSERIEALSGGQQQRVAIAAALAMRPRVLILDEPTSQLDGQGTRQVLETLSHLNREHGLTILLVEHRLEEVARAAGRAIVMHDGAICLDGSPSEVFSCRPALDRLGLRHPWAAERASDPRPVSGVLPSRRQGAPLVELRGVSAAYNRHPVLHDINLAIWPGEFVALVGDNGSGKSTLARAIAGLLRPRRGRVTWAESVRKRPLGRRVGLLLQNPLHQLVCDTVGEEIAFGPHNFGVFSQAQVEAIQRATGLAALRDRPPYRLSAGQQQRTALAGMLALSAPLLILDEPTVGQDWGHLSRFMDFIVELSTEGQAVLLITHDDKLVCRYARRIVALRQGRIVADSPSLRRGSLSQPAEPLPDTRARRLPA
jgi:energy-coupling factor transport system ATP-binding protein